MANESQGVRIPIEAQNNAGPGFAAAGADAAKLGERLRQLESAEAAASKPVTPRIKLDGEAEARAGLERLNQAAAGLGESLKLGFGIGIGEELLHSLEEIPHKIAEAFHEGLDFVKEMETGTVGLASTLRTVDPAKFFNLSKAREEAVRDLEAIRLKANELGVDFHSFEQTYSATLQALNEGGVKDFGQQLELLGTLTAAAASKGITGVQALRDNIDILNGRAGNIVLAKELGLESEALKEAAEHGQLYTLIMGKLVGYREGLAAQADTLQNIEQRFKNLSQQAKGEVAAPFLDLLKDVISALNVELAKPETRNNLRELGIEAAAVGKFALDSVGPLLRFTEILGKLRDFADPGAKAVRELFALLNNGPRNDILDRQAKSFQEINKANEQMVRNAVDEASRRAALVNLTKQSEDLSRRLVTASGEEREQLEQQVFAVDRLIQKFGELAGTVKVTPKLDMGLDPIQKRIEEIKRDLGRLSVTGEFSQAKEDLLTKLNNLRNIGNEFGIASAGNAVDAQGNPIPVNEKPESDTLPQSVNTRPFEGKYFPKDVEGDAPGSENNLSPAFQAAQKAQKEQGDAIIRAFNEGAEATTDATTQINTAAADTQKAFGEYHGAVTGGLAALTAQLSQAQRDIDTLRTRMDTADTADA